jgi:hypothetical protein
MRAMRRPTLLVALPIALLAAVGATLPASRPASAASAETLTVTIVFQCEGTRSVSPWISRIKQGDQIEWVLDPSSDVTEFEIRKKRALGRWPFQSELPARGRPGTPAVGNNMRLDARGTYAYNIEAMCPGPGGSMRKAVIDPDIIVD